jgi:hypothetical protein
VNTPAHVVVNLALLAGGERRRFAPEVIAGALAADAPIYFFYAWEKLVYGANEAVIWGAVYFRSDWQNVFDLFHSIPLGLAGLGISLALCRPGAALGFGSLLLHVAFDLPLHREDAHRHFFPLSSWRFESPVSYWDPAHHGALAAFGEATLVWIAAALLWRRTARRRWRLALAGLSAVYALAWVAFYAR